MLAKGLLEEVPAPRDAIGLGWRQDEDGACIALRITTAGLTAMGVEPEAGGTAHTQSTDGPDDDRPRDERNGVDPALVIGDLAEVSISELAPAEMALLPMAPQGDSLAAFPPAPPSPSGEAPEGHQRPPVSQRRGIGHAAALRMAAATVLAAWDAPDHAGLDDAIAALSTALATTRQSSGTTRLPRDPATPRQPRTGTKQGAVPALLRRDEGTTIADIIEATGWQPHTVRGFLAGLKRKRVNVEVLERVRQVGPDKQGAKGSYSIYRIAEAG
jgi:hypothetical protein